MITTINKYLKQNFFDSESQEIEYRFTIDIKIADLRYSVWHDKIPKYILDKYETIEKNVQLIILMVKN